MVSVLEAILLGIVQGITEWLPISSSGHLVIVQEFLGIKAPLFFDVLLHFGTLIVIFLVYYKDIVKMFLSFFSHKYQEHHKMFWFIVIGSIPTAVIGLGFRDLFVSFFTSLRAVGYALLFTGILLFVSNTFKTKKELNITDSLLIGIMQGIAIMPGISRSGATISTALLRGVKKEKAARFSFLLAVPAIIGALMLEGATYTITQADILPFAVGLISATIAGYISLKWLINIIRAGKFYKFSYYCFVLGIILVFL